jgi:hypothetical protein
MNPRFDQTPLGNLAVLLFPEPQVGWNVPTLLTKCDLFSGLGCPVDPLTTAKFDDHESQDGFS